MTSIKDSRLCPECGQKIIGRTDKKYCSDACRNAYNNRLNADSTNFIRNVNNTLRKNRRILMELNPSGKTEVHRDQLLKAGFDFEFHTRSITTVLDETYYFCYDQGYLSLDNGTTRLVKREEEY